MNDATTPPPAPDPRPIPSIGSGAGRASATIRGAAAAALALSLLAACGDDNGDVAGASASSSPAATASAATSPSPMATATSMPTSMATSTATPGPGAGPTMALGNGQVWGYVNSDSAGKPTEVGVRMTGAALEGLPADMPGMGGHPLPMILTFPSGTDTGVLNHVEFYWNPMGHEPPGVWDKPHFDYHFYMTDPESVHAIDPASPDFATKSAKIPDAKYIPADFVSPPGTPTANTIPGMGLHWADKTEPPVPGQYHFTETMINGSYDGQRTFIEPMITREWLLTHPTLDEQLKQPEAYQKAGLWPTTYSVRYDAAKDEITVALGGFTERQAS